MSGLWLMYDGDPVWVRTMDTEGLTMATAPGYHCIECDFHVLVDEPDYDFLVDDHEKQHDGADLLAELDEEPSAADQSARRFPASLRFQVRQFRPYPNRPEHQDRPLPRLGRQADRGADLRGLRGDHVAAREQREVRQGARQERLDAHEVRGRSVSPRFNVVTRLLIFMGRRSECCGARIYSPFGWWKGFCESCERRVW